MSELQSVFLCAVGDVKAHGVKGIVIGMGLEQRRYILVWCGDKIKCYLNQCPHQGTPLDTFPDKFLDETGAFLVCSMHGARFDINDGVCVLGPCVGQNLTPLEILIAEDQVYLVAKPDDFL